MMANQALNNTSFADDTDNVQEMSRSISRYDMAQLITNIMTRQGFPASSSDKSAAIAKITDYNNIPSQYRDAVANVYALGIITGYSDGSFSGEVTMNRGQAAVVIYRMMQYSGNSGGNITNPDPETPVEPETPSKPSNPSQPDQTGKTLTNGKPVTEDNILELLSELHICCRSAVRPPRSMAPWGICLGAAETNKSGARYKIPHRISDTNPKPGLVNS